MRFICFTFLVLISPAVCMADATNWEDFVAKSTAVNAAATALDASTLDSVKAGMAGIGGACKACHTAYRL